MKILTKKITLSEANMKEINKLSKYAEEITVELNPHSKVFTITAFLKPTTNQPSNKFLKEEGLDFHEIVSAMCEKLKNTYSKEIHLRSSKKMKAIFKSKNNALNENLMMEEEDSE